jgi:uroporphyrinogen-III synthase
VNAFQSDAVAACVGPVTAAAFEVWGVPTLFPERSRLAAMVNQLETELPSRRGGLAIELAGGRRMLLHGDKVLLDGTEVRLTPAPAAVLQALVANPGTVVPRRALLATLPSGQAGSEHAVEMAVARLRAAVGTSTVQTVVKRGYRLAVEVGPGGGI